MTLFTTPPFAIIFICMALHENKACIRRIVEKIHPGIEKFGKNIAARYANPKTIILLSIFFTATATSFAFLASHLRIQETDDYVNYIFIQMALTGIFASGVVAIAWVLLSLNSIFKSLLAKVLLSLVVSACIIFFAPQRSRLLCGQLSISSVLHALVFWTRHSDSCLLIQLLCLCRTGNHI
ncbi:hypothetical protein KIV45_16095 [Janthinobacterium lividum]|nr:hypothetical protein KIV45_16095 [Janthinobacterium lividum]